ncbi:MAG: hypothetical protein VB080_03680 [Propionicimonas sp.]|uniref:hypothetical protein n=1 Tax=Propionicimonas sp. TaxID=1955623 RepID=UPI002B20A7A1|nr:hypothetical protein [Propionicimonas sp.]MEA4943518.1 hypothetical protein [Propionicimonas sp.]
MTALALVESPVQLLHVLEWCHATDSAERTQVAVLAPRDTTSRRQLVAMLGYADEEGIEVRWHDPRQGTGALLASLPVLRRQVAAADRLVVGDPFSGLVQLLLPGYRGSGLVVVDDGTATMEFTARVAERSPLLRWDAPENGLRARLRRPSATRARRIFTPSPNRPVTVFTVMPTARMPGLVVLPNRYDWTRRRFARPQVVPGTDIIGTSLVESGMVAAGSYLDQIGALAGGTPGRYYAHRREAPGKLALIEARTGLQVVRPQVPLELELRRGPVAERVVGFPSSVGYTLPVVLASVGTQVELVKVEPAWLQPGVGAGARRFLDRVAVSQPNRAARTAAVRS